MLNEAAGLHDAHSRGGSRSGNPLDPLPAINHEQRITAHLNLSSDQCRYDHRMRVRGDVHDLAGLQQASPGNERTEGRGGF